MQVNTYVPLIKESRKEGGESMMVDITARKSN